jgi:acetolactate synthase-1/3 small subunit
MSDPNPPMRHVIAALVTNEPGVLAHVAGMFAARGFNIDSLVVGRTENPELSRMTIVVNGDDQVLEQVRKQLQKLVPVVKVVDYKEVPFVERDLMLVQVATDGGSSRSELIQLADLFRAKISDVAPDRVMIEISGDEQKLEAFIDLVEPYGIVELARTGIIAMPRGNAAPLRRRPAISGGQSATESGAGSSGTPDQDDLPPG